ncbi:MAG: WYL domain-containing protein [Pyrinomonadaceae bacterium]
MKKSDTPPRVYLRALKRITEIHRQIASGKYPSVRRLAESLVVNERTIKRDIAFLRNEFGAPIRFERKKGGYLYTDLAWDLPPLKMSEGDILAFFIAENALKLTGHTAEALRLKNSLAKIAGLLPDEVYVNLATLGESVGFQNRPFVSVDLNRLKRLAIASISQQTVEFDYFSPHSGTETHRIADIHLLHNFAGDWYAVSYDHARHDFRDFHLARMSNIKELSSYFKKQKGFSAEDYIKRGFSMTRGGRLATVVIHFDAYRAQWIRERNFFHPEEIREELPDKSLRLSFKIE